MSPPLLRLKRVSPTALLVKSPKEREIIRRQSVVDSAGFYVMGATMYPELGGDEIAVEGKIPTTFLQDLGQQKETIASVLRNAPQSARRTDRLASCSGCVLCEVPEDGAQPWCKCRALNRRALSEFIDNPLAACPAGRWFAEYPMLTAPDPTEEVGIIIGTDAKAEWLVRLFVPVLRKLTGCKLPIYCANYGTSSTDLPVDKVIAVPGDGLHPMYRKAASAMFSGFRWGVWYDTDVLVRISPEQAIAELQNSGLDLAVRRGELWWQIKHRGDNWHTGAFAFRHDSETLRHWASWSMAGDDAWVTATDPHGIRDEELFAELMRTRRYTIHPLSPKHARLPSEFNAVDFGMPPMDCGSDNWHFPGTPAKQRFKELAEMSLAGR